MVKWWIFISPENILLHIQKSLFYKKNYLELFHSHSMHSAAIPESSGVSDYNTARNSCLQVAQVPEGDMQQ